MATKTKIWLSSPHMGGTEQKYVQEAFDTNWVAPLGPNVNGFEEDLESYLGTGHFVAALSSGTGALHLALELAGVGQGDVVLCQSFTFAASANPIAYLGATPVFVDSEPDTWNLSPELLEKAIVELKAKGERIKAIVAVHLYGMPYKVTEITEIGKRHGIPIIEDSAEALGSSYNHMPCGVFGDFGIFSFNGNKIITTSGGGAMVVASKALKDKAVFLATQARDDAPHYQHSHIGYNYRMSNILAGIGRGQMEVLPLRVIARRANYEYYYERLSQIPGIAFLDEPRGMVSNRWLSCILLPDYETREKIRGVLAAENIESRPLWKPMHLQPIFDDVPAYIDGTSESLFERGLCLPSGSNLTHDDLDEVVSLITNAL